MNKSALKPEQEDRKLHAHFRLFSLGQNSESVFYIYLFLLGYLEMLVFSNTFWWGICGGVMG